MARPASIQSFNAGAGEAEGVGVGGPGGPQLDVLVGSRVHPLELVDTHHWPLISDWKMLSMPFPIATEAADGIPASSRPLTDAPLETVKLPRLDEKVKLTKDGARKGPPGT